MVKCKKSVRRGKVGGKSKKKMLDYILTAPSVILKFEGNE